MSLELEPALKEDRIGTIEILSIHLTDAFYEYLGPEYSSDIVAGLLLFIYDNLGYAGLSKFLQGESDYWTIAHQDKFTSTLAEAFED